MSGFPLNIVQLQEEQPTGTVVVVDPPQEVTITVAERGPQGNVGPIGPVGPTGPFNVGLVFTQTIPATPWTFTHNFGYVPIIMIYDDTGDEVDCNATADANIVTIFPAGPSTGKVRLI